jgi:hypothetical protein
MESGMQETAGRTLRVPLTGSLWVTIPDGVPDEVVDLAVALALQVWSKKTIYGDGLAGGTQSPQVALQLWSVLESAGAKAGLDLHRADAGAQGASTGTWTDQYLMIVDGALHLQFPEMGQSDEATLERLLEAVGVETIRSRQTAIALRKLPDLDRGLGLITPAGELNLTRLQELMSTGGLQHEGVGRGIGPGRIRRLAEFLAACKERGLL